MNIALLGSGSLMNKLSRAIINEGHKITIVGTNKGNHISTWEIDAFKPKIISNYTEACESDVDAIVMFSYAPLIRTEDLEKKRFINIHYALLPRFRGFHGFIWSLINDEKEVGYTVHLVDEGIDSGSIYFQHKIDITDNMNINDVRNLLDCHLIHNIGIYLTQIEDGKQPIQQDETKAIYVTKRKPEDGLINWNWPARLVFNHIRALTPPATPGAFSFYKGEKIILRKAVWRKKEDYFSHPGRIICIKSDGSVLVKCGDSVIAITEIEYKGQIMNPSALFHQVGCQMG